MLTTRQKLIIGGAVAAIFAAAAFLVFQLTTAQTATVDASGLVNGLAQYARDLRNRGVPMARTVTLETLVDLGYVTPAEVRAFHGAKLTFYAAGDDTSPQSILVVAEMPDGSVQSVLADGSVQQFTRQTWAEHLIAMREAQQKRSTNTQPTSGSETNGTPMRMLSVPDPATSH